MRTKKETQETQVEAKEEKKTSTVLNVLDAIKKKHGAGSIMMYSEKRVVDSEVISTRSVKLDSALGIGGLPRGRVVEIFGVESGGKTTVSLQVVAEVQKLGLKTAFIDVEHALSKSLCEGLGVDLNSMVISQPDYGEQALEIAQMLVESGEFAVIVIDSVAALVPKAEIEGEMGDSHIGLQARLMSQAMRKLTAIVSKSNTCLIFVNQIRSKIGVFYGNPETTTGGNALKFYSSVRLDVRPIGKVKKGEDVIGNRVRIKVVKNKLAPPFAEIETDLIFGKGIDPVLEVLELAIEKGIVVKSGGWLKYKEESIGQGIASAVENLSANKEKFEELKKLVV